MRRAHFGVKSLAHQGAKRWVVLNVPRAIGFPVCIWRRLRTLSKIAGTSAHYGGCLCRRKRGFKAGVVLPRVAAQRDDSSEAGTDTWRTRALGASGRLLQQSGKETVELTSPGAFGRDPEDTRL